MNDFEIKRLANHLEDVGTILTALGQQIIAKAVNVSAQAHHIALDLNSESVAQHKLVGVADDD